MTNVKMTAVDSTNLASVEYDKEAQKLYVEFLSGSTYVYFNLDESVYRGLMNAPSKGTYFSQNIKGVYAFNKL